MSHSRLRLLQELVIAPWISSVLNKHRMMFEARAQWSSLLASGSACRKPSGCKWAQTWSRISLTALPEQQEHMIVSTCSFVHTLGPIGFPNEAWVTKSKAYIAEFKHNTPLCKLYLCLNTGYLLGMVNTAELTIHNCQSPLGKNSSDLLLSKHLLHVKETISSKFPSVIFSINLFHLPCNENCSQSLEALSLLLQLSLHELNKLLNMCQP